MIQFNGYNNPIIKSLLFDFAPEYYDSLLDHIYDLTSTHSLIVDPILLIMELASLVFSQSLQSEPGSYVISKPLLNPLQLNTLQTSQNNVYLALQEYQKYVGFNGFNKAYDEIEKEMPEAKQYRAFLTKIALHESGFKMNILNKSGAPAYGYFLFMEDGKKYHNIEKYSGLSIEDFRKNPKAQIKAAVKLAQAFERQFSPEDLKIAQSKGISRSGLLGGAWLGGAGGVKKALRGVDSSDKHWNKNGKGSSVMECFQRYNNL